MKSRRTGLTKPTLYFQYTRSEGWSLEEGIVKTGSFSIDQGVGVRAVSGEKTAFAYSDDISEASLLDAARHGAQHCGCGPKRRVKDGEPKDCQAARSLYNGWTRSATLDSAAKVANCWAKWRSWPAPRTRAWCR
jgi:TldD protein